MRVLRGATFVLAMAPLVAAAEPHFKWDTSRGVVQIIARNPDTRRYNCVGRFTIVTGDVRRDHSIAFGMAAMSNRLIHAYNGVTRNWRFKSGSAVCTDNGSPVMPDPPALAIAPTPPQEEPDPSPSFPPPEFETTDCRQEARAYGKPGSKKFTKKYWECKDRT